MLGGIHTKEMCLHNGLPLAEQTHVEFYYVVYSLTKRNKLEKKQKTLPAFGGEVKGENINPAEWRIKHQLLSPVVLHVSA